MTHTCTHASRYIYILQHPTAIYRISNRLLPPQATEYSPAITNAQTQGGGLSTSVPPVHTYIYGIFILTRLLVLGAVAHLADPRVAPTHQAPCLLRQVTFDDEVVTLAADPDVFRQHGLCAALGCGRR